MQLVQLDEVDLFGPVGHREGGIDLKRLLYGEESTADNYEFEMVYVKDRFVTPPHRHNFDQVRYVMSGSFGYRKGKVQRPGTVGYFPEGTWYKQDAEGASSTLLLQTAGASMSPYLSNDRLRAIVDELSEIGTFDDGIYTEQRNGEVYKVDGYEAAWERAMGRKVEYPQPRYNEPVIMDPAHFHYLPVDGEPGVERRMLGTFTEREVEIGFLRLAAGSTHHFDGATRRDHLFYVLSGSGELGDDAWTTDTALHLGSEDTLDFRAGEPAEIYYIRLPRRANNGH